MNKYLLSIFLFIFTFINANSQILTVSVFTSGLNRPVSITNSGLPGDNRIFVCEKVGRIRIIDRNTGVMNATSFLNISSIVYSTGNEQGLLGLAFHPNYASNGFFYVFYNHRVGSINYTRLSRYQVSTFADTAMPNSGQVMMTVYHPFSNHNGGNLMFGKDGYLYVSMGDGGSSGDPANRAQNCDSLLGKILRLDVSNPNAPYYFSPASNPFYGGNIPSQPYLGTAPGRDEIYAWGMRNPWRCSIDRLTGNKWIADVGQNAFEEIDFESRSDSLGHNYGWRCYEGNATYNTGGCQPATSYTTPIYTYPLGSDCSVTGGFVYRGGQQGSMFGKYFFADYCSGKIWKTIPNVSGWTTTLVPQTNALFTNKFTAWGEDSYGELYLGGDGTAGVIYKIIDTACAPTAYINEPDTILNCSGNPININAIYGTGLNYNWFVDGISVSNSPNNIFSYPYNPGCHTVHVVVTGICSATSNTIVVCSGTMLLPSVGTTVSNTTICNGTSTSITGTGVATYTWQPGSLSGTTVTVTPLATTTYTVTGTNVNACVNTATRTITVNTLPSVGTTVSNATICTGTSTSITGTGATTYTWQPGSLSGTTITVTPLATTTYTVIGTNANGCTNTATRIITVNSLPSVGTTVTNTSICTGASTSITGTGAITYTWQPGSLSGNTVTVTPVATTTYTATGTNANACVKTATRIITVNPLPSVGTTVSNAIICTGASTSITGTGATTYTWQPGSLSGTTVTVTPVTTTTYTVTGTNANGCVNTATRIITVNPLPTVGTSVSNATICTGASTSITGTGATTYTWQPGSLNGTTITVTPITTTTYTVTGTNANGCVNTDTRIITVNPLPTVGTSVSNATICTGESTSITGTGAITYTWQPGSLSGTTITVTPVAVTTYTVTGTNANGCTETATRLITVVMCSSTLELKLYLQGYYTGAGLMAPVLINQGVGTNSTITDTIEVQLRNTTFPFAMVAMTKTILNTNGTTTCTFSPLNGTYFIVVKHRNTIETWSLNGISISTSTPANYDFSTASNMAYGNNQSEIESGVWALYSGDLNTDENIDLLDVSILETDINAFQFGYFATDVNGDGNVDLLDSPIVGNNVNNFIFSNHP